MSNSLAIASGKGGVGKTTISVNLALTQAKSSKCLLIDADMGMANAHILLGFNPNVTVREVIDGTTSLENAIVVKEQSIVNEHIETIFVSITNLVTLNFFISQPLDMLTMLGFVILIGIVVNNAILLVHQTLYLIRKENMSTDEAILESTNNRIRPIFMSTLTSVFGMLPLVVFPGAGSELYRGLGSVVVGGLSLSALLTLAIVPPMLKIFVTDKKLKNI